MSDIITVAIEAAQEAGRVLLEGYGKVAEIETKADRSLVTQYDRRSEKIIVARIREAFPKHRILAEEGAVGASTGEYCWVIDPLDGTHNFIRQIGHFGVSIGVVLDGEFVAGVINLPREHEFYVAEKGSGAFRNELPIHVSSCSDLKSCSMCFDSSMGDDPAVAASMLAEFSRNIFNFRVFGSSVRTLTYIAEGKIDFSVEFDDHPWDFAAGAALISEAGGSITTFGNKPLPIERHGYIASNTVVHRQVLDIVGTYHSQAGA